jgi:LPS O-antigen subunit length determinant protein (WzzB/FepE family)
MMSETQHEISAKEVVQKLKGLINYLLTKWIWICVGGIFGGVVGLMYAWNSEPKYTASLSFILSGNTDANSGLLGLASQFGLSMGSSGGNTFSSDNIISLMTSRNIVQQALQRTVPEKKETLVNLFCKDLNLEKVWNNVERTKGAFPFPLDSAKLSYVQDSLMRSVYEMVTKNFLDVSRPDKMQDIFSVTTVSKDELFSQYLTKSIVDVTAKFYINTKTKSAKENLDMLQHEADSLRSLLSGSISSTAKIYDYTYNLNPAFQAQRAPAQEGQMNVEVVSTAYGEVLKNLELAKITLQQQTPLYQIIDEPHLPLVAEKPGRLMSLIIGGFFGGFLTVIFLIGRRAFKQLWY